MIELLLRATRYGRATRACNWPHRVVFEPGCFADHLARLPILAMEHRAEMPVGRVVGAYDRGGSLLVVARTSAPEIVRPVVAGHVFDGGCSVGTHLFDSEMVEDEHGPLERVFAAHVHEVSLTRRPGIRSTGIIGWRYAY